MNRLQSVIGIGLTVIVVLAFVLMVVLSLPSKDKVSQQAQPLPNLPTDFLSDSNPLMQRVKSLKVPGGVPVTVTQDNLGRANVFAGF